MECRTPLVEFIPYPQGGQLHNQCPLTPTGGTNSSGLTGWSTRTLGSPRGNRGSVGSSRGNAGTTNNKPAQPPIKKRLPLPKNVVLMSLIEATELATESVQGDSVHDDAASSSTAMMNTTNPSSVFDMDEEEDEKIKMGTALAISDCGTYVVVTKEGLEIVPQRPASLLPPQSEEDVDALVRFYNKDCTIGDGVPPVPVEDDGDDDDDPNTEEGEKESAAPGGRLSCGDRVQIVSTQDGWAKMARGYGYIRTGAPQLRKVGGSVDRSCKLEAMLRLMSSRRKELREEQRKIDNQFIAYMNELQVSLMSDEDLTVIAADTFQNESTEINVSGATTSSSSTVTTPTSRNTAVAVATSRPSSHSHQTSSYAESSSTPLKPRPPSPDQGSYFCSSSDVLNAVLPLSSCQTTQQTQPPPLANSSSCQVPPPHVPALTNSSSVVTHPRSPAIAREFNNNTMNQ